MIQRFAIVWCVLLLTTRALAQQSVSSEGTDFIVCSDFFGGGIIATAAIGTYAANVVKVTYFTNNGEVEVPRSPLKMGPNSVATIALAGNLNKLTPGGPSTCLYHITSQEPISVQVYNLQDNRSEMYLALPTRTLGANYQIESWPVCDTIESVAGSKPGFSQFIVMAVYDNTKVTIDPSAPIIGRLNNPLVLNRGQAILVRVPYSQANIGADLTTTTISADNPIGVLAGNNHAEAPVMNKIWADIYDDFKNPMVEEIRPVSLWVRDGYISIPLVEADTDIPQGTRGADYCACATKTPTLVTGTLGAGAIVTDTAHSDRPAHFHSVRDAVHFSAPENFDVTMHAHYQGHSPYGAGVWTDGYGAPMMMNIIPISAWMNQAIWYVPPWGKGPFAQFVNIIGWKDQLRFDKLRIYRNGIWWDYTNNIVAVYDIPDHPDLQGISIKVTSAGYRATCDSNFIVYSYGRSDGNLKGAAAYGAPCAFLLKDNTFGDIDFETDSSCGGWTGLIVDHREVAYRVSDLHLDTKSTNVLLQKTHLDGDTVFRFSISILDSSKDARANVYLKDFFGTRLRASLIYTAPRFRITGSARLQRIPTRYDTCISVLITNIGKTNYAIDLLALGMTGEVFTDTSQHFFPRSIKPGETFTLPLCFVPLTKDTSIVDTLRFIAGCTEFRYPVSITTMISHVEWLTPDTAASSLCGTPDTMRIWLANTNPKDQQETITNVSFVGQDASEFSIAGNQLGYKSLANFPLDGGQRIWIDVAFTADLTKPEPARWDDRHATLVAANNLHTDPEINFFVHLDHPLLACDRATLDLGDAALGNESSDRIVLSDSGNAPVVITSVTLGNPKLTATGIVVGDTIWPGEKRTVTISALSNEPDSIVTTLYIGLVEGCVNPVVIPITFKAHSTSTFSVQTLGTSFPAAFTCTQHSAPVVFTNHSNDSIFVDHTMIVGDNSFVFTDGTQYKLLNTRLAKDSSIVLDVLSTSSKAGTKSADILFAWDSLNLQVYSSSALSADIQRATASISAAQPTIYGDNAAESIVELPVQMQQLPPEELQAHRAVVTLRYRGDLFLYRKTITKYQASSPVFTRDVNGNETAQLELTSPTGFTLGELVRLQMKVMLTFDTASPVELVNVRFLDDVSPDSLCVDVTNQNSSFQSIYRCGDETLRGWMHGRAPFSIRSAAPNPSNGAVTLKVVAQRACAIDVSVLNVLGSEVSRSHLELPSGTSEIPLDLTTMPNGCYEVTLSDGYTKERTKIELMR